MSVMWPGIYEANPYTVTAWQYQPEEEDVCPEELLNWCNGEMREVFVAKNPCGVYSIWMSDAELVALPFDWIIRDEDGKFSVLNQVKFHQRYQVRRNG